MNSHLHWSRVLLFSSLLLALQGISWILIGSFDPFGIYEGLFAKSVLNAEGLSDGERTVFRFGVGLLGATDAAFFVLFYFIVRYPLMRRERWAHQALVSGSAAWFVFDSGFSAWIGAVFNILIVNVPCLFLLGLPLLMTRKSSDKAPADDTKCG